MKAVVLARGKGTRMQRADPSASMSDEQRRYAESGVKAMMPIRGRPFLDYVLGALADAGVREVCLVVAPDHDLAREYYRRDSPPQRLRMSFAVQREARGTADAVLAVEEFAGPEDFLVLNGDNYYAVDVFRALVALGGPGLPAFSREGLLRRSNFPADRVRTFALLRVGQDGYLEDIIEKPDDETFRALGMELKAPISMNVWRLSAAIFASCRAIPPSPRGELELPEAVRHAVRVRHERFRAFPVDSGVLDLSRQSDVEEVERGLAGVEPRP